MVPHSGRSPSVTVRGTLSVVAILAVSACSGTPQPEVRASSTDQPALAISCAAESTMHEDGVHVTYVLESGVALECTATGLVADVMASWDSELYDIEWADSEEPVHQQGGLLDVVDGEARFTITVPDHPPLLSLVTWVSQGEVDVYAFGSTGLSRLGRLVCAPDPATEGETVECIAEGLPPDEPFAWMVLLHDETMEQIDISAMGHTDDRGAGTFSFDVPSGEALVGYAAYSEPTCEPPPGCDAQSYGFAEFAGTIR